MSSEFSRLMKTAGTHFDGPATPCITEIELLDYHTGALPADRNEAVQAHLVGCPACRAVLADAAAFADPVREGETEPSTEWEWAAFRRKLLPARAAWWKSNALPWAVAAGLAVAAAASLTWGWRAQQQSRVQLASLDRRLETLARERAAFEARLNLPEANVPIYDVFPPRTVDRAGEAAGAVKLRAGTSAILLLNASGQPEYPAYAAEIVDAGGKTLWRDEGLVRGTHGVYVLALRGGSLAAGSYRIRVSGRAAAAYRTITEYAVEVAPQ